MTNRNKHVSVWCDWHEMRSWVALTNGTTCGLTGLNRVSNGIYRSEESNTGLCSAVILYIASSDLDLGEKESEYIYISLYMYPQGCLVENMLRM